MSSMLHDPCCAAALLGVGLFAAFGTALALGRFAWRLARSRLEGRPAGSRRAE